MPTGYTADLEDGKITEFKDFALKCACAFFYDTTALPSEFKASTYHADALENAIRERAEILAMTAAEIEASAIKETQRRAIEKARADADRAAKRDRYRTMRAKVCDWRPPTNDHAGLKKLMLEQIDLCLPNFERTDDDMDRRYYGSITGSEWLKARLDSINLSIKYHAEEDAKERERAKERNEWVRALRESLR